jgi:hypothetical protein
MRRNIKVRLSFLSDVRLLGSFTGVHLICGVRYARSLGEYGKLSVESLA